MILDDSDKNFDKESTKALEYLESITGPIGGPWSKIIDTLGKNGILDCFEEMGIKLTEICRYIKNWRNGHEYRIDFFLMNDNKELIVGYVRERLTIDNVNEFIEVLDEFLIKFPKYKDYKIYGAIIGMIIKENADKLAREKGFFTFTIYGKGKVKSLTDRNFKPKDIRNIIVKNN